MKVNKVTIFALSLVGMLSFSSCGATPNGGEGSSGGSSQGTSLPADTIAITDLFETSANVEMSEKGLVLSSPEHAYTGKINGIFYGDTSFKLDFTETPSTWCAGDFRVTLTDALDASKTFTVQYRLSNSWTATDEEYGEVLYAYTHAYVLYDKEDTALIRSSYAYPNLKTLWYDSYQKWGDSADCSPALKKATFDRYRVAGELQFKWESDGLNVKVNCRELEPRTIAVFDGTDEFVVGESWGLPTMEFENGYIISFSSSFESDATPNKSSSVELQSITYYDMKKYTPQTLSFNRSQLKIPSFYQEQEGN
jgi:hypothetical protein